MLNLQTGYRCYSASDLLPIFMLLCFFAIPVQAEVISEGTGGTETSGFDVTPQEDRDNFSFGTVRTDSPRQTLTTFLRLKDDLEATITAYRENKTRVHANRIELLFDQLIALLDLSSVPRPSQREVGFNTVALLLDILGRVELPNLESVPNIDAFADDASTVQWRIPRTPIRIVGILEGSQEGEFLFGESTVRVAPRFYRGIKSMPLRSSLEIGSWSRAIPQLTGPMIPPGVLSIMPDSLKQVWLDTPRWKVLAVLVLIMLLVIVLSLFHRAINRGKSDNQLAFLLRRTLTPVAILIVVQVFVTIINFEIYVSGTFKAIIDTATTVVIYASALWFFWLVVLAIFERIILSRDLPENSFDTHIWRIGSRTLGVMGSVIIVGAAAQELGLPLYSIVAGLGIGGLAVALAIRPTLENLIGGIMLYLDQPIRIGDRCTFGDKTATVETIGVRSTKLRALDRSLITVPNSQLADMELINWTQCDLMLITSTIGLRYETETDQLRYIMVEFREMLHAHPKINRDTVRVRFSGYGASSLDINIRVHALTRERDEFYAIREDIFLRMKDIVEESGSGFAFPSQTLYMARDDGLDSERCELARNKVKSWRETGKLPFPRLATERIDQLEGTLDYPPRGSVEIDLPEEETSESADPLSAESDTEEADKLKG